MKPKARKKARFFAAQAMYQWEITKDPITDIMAQYEAANDYLKHVDWPFFREIVSGASDQSVDLDALYAPLLERPADEINMVELGLIRLGCFELLHRIDVPYRVVLDEYIELSKSLGTTDGHKFVNGLLHGVSLKHRAHEVGAK